MIRSLHLLFALLFCIGLQGQSKLLKLESPVLFLGESVTAYRAPAVLFHRGTFHMFFALSEVERDGRVFTYVARTESRNLRTWTKPVKITARDQNLDFSSPGNVIRYKDEWILCLQTYPRPGLYIDMGMKTAGADARIYIMRSKNLESWSEPELLKVKGPDVPFEKMGRMIDPYIIEDKDEKGKYWCFYKQNGVSMSWSYDLVNWKFFGNTDSGENVSVIVEGDEYILFHSPANGIGIKKSPDLRNWTSQDDIITLGQSQWDWAKGRIGGAVILDLRNVKGYENYLMFFYGLGPLTEAQGYFDRNVSVGIAWSRDLAVWKWPGKTN